MSEICFIALQTKTDIDQLGSLFLNQYNKNIVATLNSEEEKLLNDVANKLEELSSSNNIEFNKEGFKTFIKKIYVNNINQYGGDDELVPHLNMNPNYVVAFFDFTALLGLFLSVYLLYLAYDNLSHITQGLTGSVPKEISAEVMEQFNKALEEVNNLNEYQLTYLQFFYQVFSTLGCNIIENQIANIQQIILVGLESSFKDVRKKVTAACLESSKAESSNTVMGMVSSIFNVASAPTATIECVNDRFIAETDYIRAQIDNVRTNLFIKIRTRSYQLVGNVSLAVKIGVPCTSYLLSRIVYVTSKFASRISGNIKNSNISFDDDNDENQKDFGPFRITERGGRKRYTKKYRKHRKTLKRSRKTFRKKYKSFKRKSKKI